MKRNVVLALAGSVIGGFPGWLTWRLVHLARISTFRNKAATLLDWTTAFFYDGHRKARG